MPTLTEFLLARIAEDEAVAQASAPYSWTADGGDVYAGHPTALIAEYVEVSWAAHIARHDPARVLAECKAKREIVGLYSSVQFGEGVDGRPVPLGGAGPEVYWEAVCILALP